MMLIGTSQVDITPEPGVELSGFAARIQPSIGVLDPLHAKGLYITEGEERLLWIHADLVGLEREFVQNFREWAEKHLGLKKRQIMISATHTHSGPATIHLLEAGIYDPGYMEFLLDKLKETAKAAMANPQSCDVVITEGRCDLTVDRRNKASAHTDPRVIAIGFKRSDGTFACVLVNYPMHAVALGPSNRQVSADIPGQVALRMSEKIPGNPKVLVTNGACGNLNPPCENVPLEQVKAWAAQIADSVVLPLLKQSPLSKPIFRIGSRIVPLPVDLLTVPEIEAYAQRAMKDADSMTEWGDKFRRAIDGWRKCMTRMVEEEKAEDHRDAELYCVRFGDVLLLGLNAEVFSRFTDLVREMTGRRVYVVGYANGVMGYLPTKEAYEEGGYEVETAHLFYCAFRPSKGGLELLAEQASDMIEKMS